VNLRSYFLTQNVCLHFWLEQTDLFVGGIFSMRRSKVTLGSHQVIHLTFIGVIFLAKLVQHVRMKNKKRCLVDIEY
jgi:hypothetical protein